MTTSRCRYTAITREPSSPDMADFFTHSTASHKFVIDTRSEMLESGVECLTADCPICGVVYMETLFGVPTFEQLSMFDQPTQNYWRIRIEGVSGEHFSDVFLNPAAALRWGLDVVHSYDVSVMFFEMTLTDTAPLKAHVDGTTRRTTAAVNEWAGKS